MAMKSKPKAGPRDPTYGDETSIRVMNAAADNLRCVIVRAVSDPDARRQAISLVNQATVAAFAAIRAQ